jgi:hypothetical protein
MAPTITLSKDFDISNVSFSDVKTLDNGGKLVYVSYRKAPLLLQTPQMKAPFGLSKWDNDGKASAKYTLDLSFQGVDGSNSLSAFQKVLETIDDRLVTDGFANQSTWFKGKKYASREIVEALYTPVMKYAKDRETGEKTDKYPPTVKLTVPFKDDAFTCDVYDDKKELVDLAALETKGSKVTAIIQCMGVWMAGGRYGASWKIVQMRVLPSSMHLKSYAFQDDSDEDDSVA